MTSSMYIKLTEAARVYEVTRNRLLELVREGSLHSYYDPLDNSVTLLKRDELDSVLRGQLQRD